METEVANLALHLYGPALSAVAEPHIPSSPVTLRIGENSWAGLTIAEAETLSQQLADAVASLRAPVGVIQTGNADLQVAA